MNDTSAIHVHLDAVGGVAGDMFAAALVDARPELEAPVQAALKALDLPPDVFCAFCPHNDGILAGRRLIVEYPAPPHATSASTLAAKLRSAVLPTATRERALAMLNAAAEAEAAVHAVPVEQVRFHELGGWDTLVDFAAAAAAVESLGAKSWSAGPLPRGRGTVETAHGTLPLPAPAVVELLAGHVLVDDGLEGERITPTGAAILRHLAVSQAPDATPRRLVACGHGFGTRTLKGRSNVLRVSLYETPQAGHDARPASDSVAQLSFDIDDQTPEDLALALNQLRDQAGVIDIVQHALIGKRGRLAMRVEILARPELAGAVAERCFAETTTLGLRCQWVDRLVLSRETARIDSADSAVRVKMALRPDGIRTAKAEIADVSEVGGYAVRVARRATAEEQALAGRDDDD